MSSTNIPNLDKAIHSLADRTLRKAWCQGRGVRTPAEALALAYANPEAIPLLIGRDLPQVQMAAAWLTQLPPLGRGSTVLDVGVAPKPWKTFNDRWPSASRGS